MTVSIPAIESTKCTVGRRLESADEVTISLGDFLGWLNDALRLSLNRDLPDMMSPAPLPKCPKSVSRTTLAGTGRRAVPSVVHPDARLGTGSSEARVPNEQNPVTRMMQRPGVVSWAPDKTCLFNALSLPIELRSVGFPKPKTPSFALLP
jgi:hypothetical protein